MNKEDLEQARFEAAIDNVIIRLAVLFFGAACGAAVAATMFLSTSGENLRSHLTEGKEIYSSVVECVKETNQPCSEKVFKMYSVE